MNINPENYITIQGFMVTELGLKGNELILYALIYGFTQDGESEFSGSIKYMCDWTGCSRPTVSNALQSLVSKGYIEKRAETINGVTFNRYKISLGVVKNLYGGSKEILWGGSKETLPYINNIDNNRDINIKRKEINKEKKKRDNSENRVPLLDAQAEFEQIWKKYPKKQGKDRAFNAYFIARRAKTPRQVIEDGLNKYIKYINDNHIETKYIKQGSTWFNQKCWEDEYEDKSQEYSPAPDSAYDLSKW